MIAAARSAVFADDRCDAVTMLLPAVITFANAAMLAATAAVALPLAVHLLNRRQPRTVVFPTVRFLRAAAASQSRVHRLRHLILLALRCAFIALLALAFARPVWFRSADAAAAADRDTVAILVLDLSASMSYVEPPLRSPSRPARRQRPYSTACVRAATITPTSSASPRSRIRSLSSRRRTLRFCGSGWNN